MVSNRIISEALGFYWKICVIFGWKSASGGLCLARVNDWLLHGSLKPQSFHGGRESVFCLVNKASNYNLLKIWVNFLAYIYNIER